MHFDPFGCADAFDHDITLGCVAGINGNAVFAVNRRAGSLRGFDGYFPGISGGLALRGGGRGVAAACFGGGNILIGTDRRRWRRSFQIGIGRLLPTAVRDVGNLIFFRGEQSGR